MGRPPQGGFLIYEAEMKKLPFQKSDELIDSFLDKILDSKKGQLLKVKNVWNECVGKDLSCHTEPEEVNGGILYVKVKSSLWKKELKMTMGRMVEEKVRAVFPEIKKIVWR